MIDAATRALVRDRAGHVCEYCQIHQDAAPFATFHIEHIVPRAHGGGDETTSLALACHHCNFHKGPNLSGIDPETGVVVPLFNPRKESWTDHFRLVARRVEGLSPTERATVRVLSMNNPDRLPLRIS